MIHDFSEGKLSQCIALARTRQDTSLIKCLQRLKKRDKSPTSYVNIFRDFAPYSLYFEKYSDGKLDLNGGIIFHGRHDNGGDGSFPTLSVCLTPVNGWCIHT